MQRFSLAATVGFWITAASTAMDYSAAEIIEKSGVSGGFVAHVGCGNGRLTASLGASGPFAVHGLDRDPLNVAAARDYIRSQGLYGRISVERFDGESLPYADNLINLLVVEDRGRLMDRELMRVLVPKGVLCSKADGQWSVQQKPRPDNIGEWTHFLQDAGNNPVAKDTVVGPPRRLQWTAPPLWLRSHETPTGFQGLVTGGGRLFYILDEGPIGIVDPRFPEKWSLVARDAFNGKLLWKRSLDEWGWPFWESDPKARLNPLESVGVRGQVPDANFRRMVIEKDRLVVTLGFSAPVSILDAATGEIVATARDTEGTDWVIVSDSVAVAARKDGGRTNSRTMTAIDVASGAILWEKVVKGLQLESLAAKNRKVFYVASGTLACLELSTGERSWNRASDATHLVAYKEMLVSVQRKTFTTFNANDGTEICQGQGKSAGAMYISRDIIWFGPNTVRRPNVAKSSDVMAVGYDIRTGEQIHEVLANNLFAVPHHARCYRNKATERFIICGKEGAEFLDLYGGKHSQNNWVRGACLQGIVPANGFLYAPPDQCFCEPGAKVLGLCAIGPAADEPAAVPDRSRLIRCEAYGSVEPGPESSPDDWPTYRNDAARWGASGTRVGAEIHQVWKTKLGGKLTPPVAAAGRLFVAAIDRHRLYALDQGTGETMWTYIAGGRIDSPPTLYRGLVLFGCRDGRVYCLRESDGKEVWRFLAARFDRRIGSFDQLESTWPVHGSVLVRDDKVYFSAGRSTYLDSGIDFYALNPFTGQIIHQGHIEGPHATRQFREDSFSIQGANSDVLVSEDDYIYMRQKKLAPDLREIEIDDLTDKGGKDVGRHVFSTASLLDGSWYNRTFWMYSKRWPGFQLANQSPKAGQILVIDDDVTYALRVFYQRNRHSPFFFPGKQGYLLFADESSNEPQLVGEKGAQPAVVWLPEDGYSGRLNRTAHEKDKGTGYTRARPPLWMTWVKVRVRGMVKAGDFLFAAGPPDIFSKRQPFATFEGDTRGVLVVLSVADGKAQFEAPLDSPPVFDGLVAAGGSLYMSHEDGSVTCLSGKH